MKKLLFGILLSVLLSLACYASFLHEMVEISFSVGESVLLINGEEKTVETPYIVGEGVTLVPVRVITEAFGATVGWDGVKRKVTLATDESEIELRIGEKTALVDGKEIELLSAPEISNNVTMVPLRFISEGFGAEVSYDNESKAVLVKLDKGPVVENGMQYFDDGSINISVPEEYVCVSNNEMTEGVEYRFVKSLEKSNSDYDTIWNYVFTCPVLDDVRQVIESDRSLQSDAINNKAYTVSKIEKTAYNDIDVYSYNISYKKNSNSFIRVKKSLYSFGEYSYFTVSAYDSYYNTGKFVRDDNGLVTGIDYSSYSLFVPEEFFGVDEPKITPLDISGKANPEIKVSVYKANDDFDVKAFLEAEEDSYRYIIYQRTISASRVKEYEFGGKTLLGYELSYVNGGREYNIISHEGEHFVYFKFTSDNFDRAEEIISSFNFDQTNEKRGKPHSYDEEKYISVETDTFTFELPAYFEMCCSDDGKLLFAVDTKTNMILNFYYDITTVACETYCINTTYNPYTNPFSNIPDVIEYVGEKKELSNLASDTMKVYEKKGWDVLNRPPKVRPKI